MAFSAGSTARLSNLRTPEPLGLALARWRCPSDDRHPVLRPACTTHRPAPPAVKTRTCAPPASPRPHLNALWPGVPTQRWHQCSEPARRRTPARPPFTTGLPPQAAAAIEAKALPTNKKPARGGLFGAFTTTFVRPGPARWRRSANYLAAGSAACLAASAAASAACLAASAAASAAGAAASAAGAAGAAASAAGAAGAGASTAGAAGAAGASSFLPQAARAAAAITVARTRDFFMTISS